MLSNLKEIIENTFEFSPNKNQLQEIERLVFEITRQKNTHPLTVIEALKKESRIDKFSGRNKFFGLKNALIRQRFPLTSEREEIDAKKVFLNKLRPPLKDNWRPNKEFAPLKIFVEKEVKKSWLIKNFQKKFPKVTIEEVNSYSEYLKKNKFTISQLKKPLVFIIKEKWDFLKPCPCTKYHLSCGYWILNLGFGCPYDCSYCFLQHYTNFPGIILPGNLEDFFEKFDAFAQKLNRPIRIGTGEFCDSLALDNITEYSQKLIPYFKKKNVYFELKTKSAQVENILKINPSLNIIISWSLNPASLIETEEIATASLEERLKAAREVQKKGYGCGFHFDPIIYSQNWQSLYEEVIDKLYTYLKPPFAWISLGSLRSNRELKTIVELRFPQSNIFYGELFLGEDKKLRYPKFLRKEIYRKMKEKIRKYDQKTPVYLCMESKDIWSIIDKNLNSTPVIERYLLNL